MTLLDGPGERFKTSPTGHQYVRVLPYTPNQHLKRKAIVHIAGRGAAEIGVAVTSALERQYGKPERPDAAAPQVPVTPPSKSQLTPSVTPAPSTPSSQPSPPPVHTLTEVEVEVRIGTDLLPADL